MQDDGEEALEDVAAAGQYVPVIFISALGAEKQITDVGEADMVQCAVGAVVESCAAGTDDSRGAGRVCGQVP
jgi:hypothetical protein